jgi:cytochrome P450
MDVPATQTTHAPEPATDTPGPTRREQVPTAGLADGVKALTQVFLPVAARGAIVRRPRVVSLVERIDADSRAVTVMQHLRDTYGPGPVQVEVPGRRLTFLLDPEDVHRVLNGAPEPFRPDTAEKRAALAHFQPDGVLASAPRERAVRRPFNESVLDSGRTLHRIAEPATAAVDQEVAVLLEQLEHDDELDWDRFATVWWRIVRRVVLGDSARDDDRLTDHLLRLRRDGNWSYLRPRRNEVRERFLAGLRSRLDKAEPGSLAQVVAETPAAPGTEPHQQVPQWLFAFDAAAWATFRALALLGAHPDAARRVREELDGAPDLPYARASVLESLRLWPTTPAILRETHVDTTWRGKVLPAGASIMIFAPFFHRDETRLPEAHRFAPELWLRERTDADHPLVPFSGGPAMCPGRNFTLLVASQVLARLTAAHDLEERTRPLDPGAPMPGTLDPFRLRFAPRGR